MKVLEGKEKRGRGKWRGRGRKGREMRKGEEERDGEGGKEDGREDGIRRRNQR